MLRTVSGFVVACLLATSSAVAQTQALPAEQLKKIKAATVFVKVTIGRFGGGSGSGFVVHAAKDYGLIITNDHVIDPAVDDLPEALRGKAKVEVVFNSGTRDEWSGKAEVLYTNKVDDLALLKVKAIKPIPEPLALAGADKLPETTPVYVCGFPFGERLASGEKNPEISIGAASVSSNRTDADGEVATVQLNGALNPGNSGGPVVTQEGKLVGVAVRTVTGAGIGFAVPPRLVRRAVEEVHFSPPTLAWVAGPPRKVRLESKFLDALGRLKTATAYVAPSVGNAFKARNADDVSKMADAKTVVPTVNAPAGQIVIEFEPPTTPHYWLQFVWTDVDGQTHRTRSEWLASEEAKPDAQAPRPTFPKVEFATTLPPTPKAQIDVDELNRTVGKRMGERLTVDLLTLGSCEGFGDGPSLKGYNRHRQMPPGLDFLLDANLAEKLSFARFNGEYVAVRITGTVHGPASGRSWDLFIVEEVKLLKADGAAIETHARQVKANLPPARPRPAPEPQPMASVPSPPLPRVSPDGPQPLPTEPYPLGGAEAQAFVYSTFKAFKPGVLGQRYRFSVTFFGSSGGDFQFQEKTVKAVSLAAKSPDTGQPLSAVRFLAPQKLYEQVWAELTKQPNKQLPCVFEFHVLNFKTDDQGKNQLAECLLTSINLADVADPQRRILFEAEWPAGVAAAVAKSGPILPGTRNPASPSLKPLPHEPFPFGNAQTQIDLHDEVTAGKTTFLGKRHLFSVVLVDVKPGYFGVGGHATPAGHLHIRCPETRHNYPAMMFFVPADLNERLTRELQKQPNRELPCVIEFQPMPLPEFMKNAGRADCMVTSVRFADVTTPTERITLTPAWPEEIKAAAKLAPARSDPPPATPLRAVPVGANPPAADEVDRLWPIVGTVLTGAVIAAVLARTILKGRRPKAKVGRGRDQEDEADFDDRPRRRRL